MKYLQGYTTQGSLSLLSFNDQYDQYLNFSTINDQLFLVLNRKICLHLL